MEPQPIDSAYKTFRSVAEPLEDLFYGRFGAGRSPECMAWLCRQFLQTRSLYVRVISIELIVGALIVQVASLEPRFSSRIFRRLDYFSSYLLRCANFDPRASISTSGYFQNVREDLGKAKAAAVRACVVAESTGVYVRDANQTLMRVCFSAGDWPMFETAAFRVLEYSPGLLSPDAAVEVDIIAMVEAAPIPQSLKRDFLLMVAQANRRF